METLLAYGIATGAATVLAPIITQLTKRKLGVDSVWAYVLHVVVSAGLTTGAMYATGELNFGDFAKTFTGVAFGSQTLFQLFKKKSGLKIEDESPEESVE